MTLPVAFVLTQYLDKVNAGEFDLDPAQQRVAERLDTLLEELHNYRLAAKSSALGWLFARHEKGHPIKGLYIYGGVGRGKTMLMDLFHDAAPDLPKRRVHFHEFMRDVHDRIGAWRKEAKRGAVKGDDPIAPVARQLAQEAKLLCFDEMQVEDIADAMILSRLFAQLFRRRVIVVATSNSAPGQLYADGLNRPLFLPFVDLIRERMNVVRLDARVDYRLEKLAGRPVYFQPLDHKADGQMERMWRQMTGRAAKSDELVNQGRRIKVPAAANGVARFSFADLCERPLGASDYLKIAQRYHTLFVDRIPELTADKRNEARRLINLIDALYDNRVKLVASAAREPACLYSEGDGAEAFMRTASRLIEMRSGDYLASPHGPRSPTS